MHEWKHVEPSIKLTTPDLDALEAVAKAATPGPWTNEAVRFNAKKTKRGRDWWCYLVMGPKTHPIADAYADEWDYRRVIELNWIYLKGKEIPAAIFDNDLAYICAANPAVVLALIARIRELEQQ